MARNGEEIIFSEADVGRAGNMLKAMLIRILIEKKITFDKFSLLHREYALRVGIPLPKIASDRNNIIRTIHDRDKLTYNMFTYITKNILGFNLKNISMVLRDKENKTYLLSMDRLTF